MYVLFVLHGFKLVVDTYQLFLLFKITSYIRSMVIISVFQSMNNIFLHLIYLLFVFISFCLSFFASFCICVCLVLITAVFKVLLEIAWIAVFHHRQTYFFFGLYRTRKQIFRVVTKKIGRWGIGNTNMANIFFSKPKKKAFRFFNILFISYNNFIINYKTVHKLEH